MKFSSPTRVLTAVTATIVVAGSLLVGTPASAQPLDGTPQITLVSPAVVGVSSESQLIASGAKLNRVAAIYVGKLRATELTHMTDNAVTFVAPQAPKFQAGKQRISVLFTGPVTGQRVKTKFFVTYKVLSKVDRQLQYIGKNLHAKGTKAYKYYPKLDCANFASQALRARGLKLTAAWHPGSLAWIASRYLRPYLINNGYAVQYKDSAATRARVVVGDIVQFDWNRDGKLDHTGTITRVAVNAAGKVIVYYSAHTDGGDKPSENRAIAATQKLHEKYYHLSKPGYVYFLHFKS
jgi:hypothetical protein